LCDDPALAIGLEPWQLELAGNQNQTTAKKVFAQKIFEYRLTRDRFDGDSPPRPYRHRTQHTLCGRFGQRLGCGRSLELQPADTQTLGLRRRDERPE
jgi:hypothetical protein